MAIDPEIIEEVVAFRRELHRNPELSSEEHETSRRIRQRLDDIGVPYTWGYAGTGVLGVIEGEKPGPVIGLRADIDALPITEMSGDPFSSEKEGVMHACGHDAHTAMLYGTAKNLLNRRKEIEGSILLIFQPAEEQSPTGGSQRMMDDGVFDEYNPEVLIAQHVWPQLPPGEFGVMAGPIMGNSDRFKIKVTGSGGHAAMPHDTTDAIAATNQIVTALQTIVSRNADPFDPAVVTIGKFNAGSQYNVIAETALLEGTIRTQSANMKHKVKKRFFEVVENVSAAMGAEVEIEYFDGYPATVNDRKWADQVHTTLSGLYGEKALPVLKPSLGGEDFSRFLQNYPGVYYWLGSSTGDAQKPLHNPSFRFNEDAILYGIEGMTEIALDTLRTLKKDK